MMFRKSRIPFLRVTLFLLIYCLIILNPFELPALERGETISDYIMNVYSIADGLPQNSVLCLTQGSDGYLWFGTRSGLVRFDGVTPRIFNRWNTPQLKSDTILSLFEDRDGFLWMGTDGAGFVSKKGEEWRAYTTEDGLSNNRVRVVFKDSRGDLWAGTDYGLNRVRDGQFKVYTTMHGLAGNAVNAIIEGRNGDLWIGTDSEALNLLKDGNFQSINIRGSIPVMEITALHEDRSENLWVGTEYGLYRFRDGEVRLYRAKNGVFNESIRTIAEDSDGSLWIGTYGSGLAQLKDDLFSRLFTGNGFLDDFIHAILEDNEGNLWIGSYTSGLIQLQNSRVISISRENGLPENMTHTVYEDRQGFLWIGTRNSGLCKYGDNRVEEIFSIEEGLGSNRVRSLFQDSDGALWIGTAGSGLNRLKDGNFSHYGIGDGLSSDNITAILRDSSAALWIGTDKGLNLIKEGKITRYDRQSGLPDTHKNINVLLEQAGGGLLIGTKRGLTRFRDGKFQPFFTGKTGIDSEVLSLYEDPDKNLWVGTNGSGLACLRNGKVTAITKAAGLYNNYIFSILPDGRGNLWMSSYRGVFRSAIKELVQFADSKTQKVTSLFFDERDGMKSSECVSHGQPAACRTAGGLLCFPTVKGVSIFDPSAIKVNEKPPEVLIEDVIIDNVSVKKGKHMVFSAKTKMVEFYFTGLSFRAPGRVRFKYQLEGFEEEWVETEPRQKRTAYYINLGPGDYCFRVIARSDDGIWNKGGASFNFKIKSYFFKRPVFYIFLIVLLLVCGAGISRFLKTRKRIRKKAEKYKTSALDTERAEEILFKLLALMEKEKVYLDADLTLKKLSERLMIHYNHLSRIINEKLQHSFNDFVNKYRIEEARKKLLDPVEGKKTVLEIAYDTGFYSKSVFNTAFKKFTGMTPSQFRKKRLQE